MILTKYGIEMMGYTEYPKEDSLEIEFGILMAYTLSGVNFEKDCDTQNSEIVSFGKNCTVATSHSINDASKLLTGDVFIDEEEEKWLSEKKVKPPFLLAYFKESSHRILRGGYRQEKDGYIYTYDAFPEGKAEIKEWESESLPNIITSLTVHFSTLDRQVLLVPVARSVFGVTESGQTLFDLKLTGGAVGLTVSSYKKVEEVNSSLLKSNEFYRTLTKDTTRHFYAALNETDKLKQFLNYFLFLERYTHSQYKALSYSVDASKLINIPDRLKAAGSRFFESQFNLAKNLAQRFHWCAMLAWENIDDLDLACFLEAKKLRDRISHGEKFDESTLPVEKIKTLSLKLLGTM